MKDPRDSSFSSPFRIAATIILYNPPPEVGGLVRELISQVEHIVLVDNSDLSYELPEAVLLAKEQSEVTYRSLNGNKGIGLALNVACSFTEKLGFDYLLTLDQDVIVPPEFVAHLREALALAPRPFGIIAPRYSSVKRNSKTCDAIQFTQTAGNLVNLEAHKKVGGFIEELFIDHVDHEFCLRLQRHGYSVIRFNNVELFHRPGKSQTIFEWMGIVIVISTHVPVRSYYFIRNGFYVTYLYGRRFPRFVFFFMSSLLREAIKLSIQRNRGERIRMLWLGFRDFRRRKFGPAPDFLIKT